MGPDLVFLNTTGSRDSIALNQDPNNQDVAGDRGGVAHFGFRLESREDLDAAIAEVVAAGGRIVQTGEHSPEHRFAYIADPDGYVIEL